ncbi:MAG: hypothetical protein M3066_15190 [Actinomycetota bacterium]|nr:hypothetical protein [Actinomycetota bacterium]
MAALGLVMAGCSGTGAPVPKPAAGGAFSIAVWGDTPYTPAEAIAVPKLVDQVNAANPLFTVFVGDLQGGDRCVNGLYTAATDTFNSFVAPMVYTPGDNEWTDCHVTAGDPIERLGYLRRTMFATNHSFGQHTVTVQQQPQYPENARWETHSVIFTTIDVPGSNDNHIADPDADEQGTPRTPADRRAAEAEYQARDQADRVWLHRAFAAATTSGAAAVVIAMQADPGFDVAPASRAAMGVDGFDKLLAALATEAATFAKPVVIIHGDSHRQRFDHPLVDPQTRQPVANVARVESYGSPNVGWVKLTFDPADPAFVSVEPHAVAGPAAS